MRLKSLTLAGFKSFPDRTRLEFGPGVSVVVGPNGSGKSNVTDAVLWAMGEQSPLAVRGQSMQDVIFGGGKGVQPRSAAEVEIVLDNSDGRVDLPLSEISIVRRLERTGDGGYRLNGARCRLTDVIEVLSDTGLGKETHSVISQGRVESIVTSKPRDRRLLIEEAAGLGKHRKRRRRAQLKLEHTQDNLDRALDVEREARSRLRPLKRQAEAAELHARLELQILQARWELARDVARTRGQELAQMNERVAGARERRTQVERELQETVDARGTAERALAERAERRDALAGRLYAARSARERVGLRGEQVASASAVLERRIERAESELAELSGGGGGQADAPADAAAGVDRIGELERQLAELERQREQELQSETAELQSSLAEQVEQVQLAEAALAQATQARERADELAEGSRTELTNAEHRLQDARRDAARVGAELAAANQFLRGHAGVTSDRAEAPRALSDELKVQDGYELALAAALGGRLDAALVKDVGGAQALLDRAGPDGASALLADLERADVGVPTPATTPAPMAGAVRLLDVLDGPPAVMELATRLLGDAWVVEDLQDLPAGFEGVAATRRGRVWFAALGEVRQLSEGGTERVLARRNERDRLIESSERAAQAEHAARAEHESALERVREQDVERAGAEEAVRGAQRARTEALEAARRTEWLIQQRHEAPAQGALAVRKAELEGELAAERRQLERAEHERAQRAQRIAQLSAQRAADARTLPAAVRLASTLAVVAQALDERVTALEGELALDREAGEQMASTLRECAAREAEIQTALRASGEAVTETEVAAQRVRDQLAEAEQELHLVAEGLGLSADDGQGAEEEDAQAPTALSEEEIETLRARVARLSRRREQLGPVNPLAQEEYAQALAHVEELETQREDLETALRELRSVIADTDRQIQETFAETFAAAARNFEELAKDVFPGGSGRLKLVEDERAPSPVLGGQPLPGDGAGDEDAIEAAAEAESEAENAQVEEQLPGVEIEITPAGKSTKRLTLLSGGEKSMTALAFLFAVFLARPCPFYILDEVEAALDDLNLDRFLTLLRRYSDRAQFIVITHQKRTMDAADCLYGVSMGDDGVSKVLSRRLDIEQPGESEAAEVA
jgi:chromosome segregation protein